MGEKFVPYNPRTLDLYELTIGEARPDLSVMLSEAIRKVDPELKNPYVPEVAGKDFAPNSKPTL